jgi:hypothetical protein
MKIKPNQEKPNLSPSIKTWVIIILLNCYVVRSSAQEIIKSRSVVVSDFYLNIPLPKGYNYFDESVFKQQKMSEFNRNFALENNKTNEIEILIPSLDKALIQIYSLNELDSFSISQEHFDLYKNRIKRRFVKSTHDSVSNIIYNDSAVIGKLGNITSKLNTNKILFESKTRLALLLNFSGSLNNKPRELFIISNYLLINETIIVIRFTRIKKPDDFMEFIKFQNEYIKNILKLN